MSSGISNPAVLCCQLVSCQRAFHDQTRRCRIRIMICCCHNTDGRAAHARLTKSLHVGLDVAVLEALLRVLCAMRELALSGCHMLMACASPSQTVTGHDSFKAMANCSCTCLVSDACGSLCAASKIASQEHTTAEPVITCSCPRYYTPVHIRHCGAEPPEPRPVVITDRQQHEC